MKYVFIEGRREGYSPGQIRQTVTVRGLIDMLEEYDEDALVMLDNDNGYTYGSVDWDSLREVEVEDEEV